MPLTDYGIQTEQSHFRAHVSIVSKAIYLYATDAGNRAIRTGKFKVKPTYLGGEKTAEGYCIPPRCIPGCLRLPIPDELLESMPILPFDLVTEKGRKAEFYVMYVLRELGPVPVTDRQSQYAGVDLQTGGIGIQVKCDYEAGEQGTGNLYLQISEHNVHRNW